jgi:hypothetical protein
MLPAHARSVGSIASRTLPIRVPGTSRDGSADTTDTTGRGRCSRRIEASPTDSDAACATALFS